MSRLCTVRVAPNLLLPLHNSYELFDTGRYELFDTGHARTAAMLLSLRRRRWRKGVTCKFRRQPARPGLHNLALKLAPQSSTEQAGQCEAVCMLQTCPSPHLRSPEAAARGFQTTRRDSAVTLTPGSAPRAAPRQGAQRLCVHARVPGRHHLAGQLVRGHVLPARRPRPPERAALRAARRRLPVCSPAGPQPRRQHASPKSQPCSRSATRPGLRRAGPRQGNGMRAAPRACAGAWMLRTGWCARRWGPARHRSPHRV